MSFRNELGELGFALCRGALGGDELASLLELLQPAAEQKGVRTRGRGAYAAQNLLWERSGIRDTFARTGLDQLASEALGGEAFAINVTYFDKSPDANWIVPPHQDLMMPVEREADEPGFTGFRTKLGVVYGEPPVEVLSNLVALRVHLDACPASNGALAVVPGSHRRGKLRDADILAIPADQFTICAAAAGDILVMKPLLVHRSSPATVPSHRRVLHIVYAAAEPGENLRWKRAL
jgi:ectoine hydroxylase-related dioxygenase (phytanoyl-CoA dioxygenase family)